MNIIQGYGISLLCFLFGIVSIPGNIETPLRALSSQHIQPAVDEGDFVVLGSLWQQPDEPEEFLHDSSALDEEPEDVIDQQSVSSPGIEENFKQNHKSQVSLPRVKNDHPGRRKAIPSDKTMRCPELEETLKDYGLYPIETWSYIAWRESRCRPDAQNATWDENGNVTYMLNKNGTYDTGLLQINSSWKTVTSNVCGKKALRNRMQGLKDIDCNLRVARYIMENSSGGLSNWNM